MKKKLDSSFWNSKYKKSEIGWDLGHPTPFFKKYLKKIDSNKIICFPGAGYGHDPIYYASKGYEVSAIEYAEIPSFYMRSKNLSNLNIIQEDFFKLNSKYFSYFDIVFEYTFFCAINPLLRTKYFAQMHKILKKDGEILGLFLPLTKDDNSGPPYAVSIEEIKSLIFEKFQLLNQQYVEESIEKRKGNEIFLRMKKIEN